MLSFHRPDRLIRYYFLPVVRYVHPSPSKYQIPSRYLIVVFLGKNILTVVFKKLVPLLSFLLGPGGVGLAKGVRVDKEKLLWLRCEWVCEGEVGAMESGRTGDKILHRVDGFCGD